MKKIIAVIWLSLACAAVSFAEIKASALSSNASSADAEVASAAIAELRAMGPAGLQALFTKYGAEIQTYSKTGESTADWKRVARALDTVAMQYDAYTAGLYWYTDLDAAKRAAKAQNKPILSLRLLGNLNEEYSCANSRLFRALLYSNGEIADFLRNNYILHWKSVRPAPRITIDFGDGRKIERTITGNSIHYILDAEGTVIDAIPGLYEPQSFLRYLTLAQAAFKQVQGMTLLDRRAALLKFRKAGFDLIVAKRQKAIEKAGVKLTESKTGTLAIRAAPIAVSKAMVADEYSILRTFDDFAKFEPSINFDDWTKLSDVFITDRRFHDNSIAMIKRQNKNTGLTDAEFAGMYAKLNSYVALDTTRNEFLLHTKIYEWLNDRRVPRDLEVLNARIYDEIFQTPNGDKWLGLYSSDVYTALDGNGIVN